MISKRKSAKMRRFCPTYLLGGSTLKIAYRTFKYSVISINLSLTS